MNEPCVICRVATGLPANPVWKVHLSDGDVLHTARVCRRCVERIGSSLPVTEVAQAVKDAVRSILFPPGKESEMKCFLCEAACDPRSFGTATVTGVPGLPGRGFTVCRKCVVLSGTDGPLVKRIADKALRRDSGPGPEKGLTVITKHQRLAGKPTDEALANKFSHHAPFGDQAERYAKIRAAALAFATVVRDLVPDSPELTRAVNEIHLAMMIANSAIALNEKPEQPQ